MNRDDQSIEAKLWAAYKHARTKDAKNAKDALVLYYLGYVKYICQRMAMDLPAHMRAEDLVSSGVVGLIDAIDKFDDRRDNLFKTYAFIRIRGAVYDELRKFDWAPRALRGSARKIKKATIALEQKLSRHPRIEEIAKELKVSSEMVSRVKQEVISVSLLSLEEALSGEDDKSFSRKDILADDKEVSPRHLYEVKEKQELIARQIEKLSDNERLAITLYYYEEMNLKEIGVVLGISESRVCQLHTQAIDHIRRGIKKCSTSVYEE